MRSPNHVHVLAFIVALTGACGGDDESTSQLREACAEAGSAGLSVAADPLGALPVTKDVVVTGKANHASGFAIHNVVVDGNLAKLTGFNFSTWEATVPKDTLGGRVETEGDNAGKVQLDIVATDACGEEATESIYVELIEPVNQLSFDPIGIPGGESYLPADPSTVALITLRANADAVGARVTLESTRGTFAGLIGNTVTLVGDGVADATASVLFGAADGNAQGGVAILTASTRVATASTNVTFAGAPIFSPTEAGTPTLQPEQILGLLVKSDGRLVVCQATPANDLSVTVGTQDLGATPYVVPTSDSQAVAMTVTASAALAGPTSVTITCTDAFEQQASITIQAAP